MRSSSMSVVMMSISEAIVRASQQRHRYILKQDVTRYGSTSECETCTTLIAEAQRVTKTHSDECRTDMDELMPRDEDALVQQRLHSDRLRRGSTVVEASGDERRDPDVEAIGSDLSSGSDGEISRDEDARGSTRIGTLKLRGVVERPFCLGQQNPCKRR